MTSIKTMAQAEAALEAVGADVADDMGEEMVDQAWGDIVRTVARECTPRIRKELLRREGIQ